MINEQIVMITDILPSKQMTAGNVLTLIHDELQTKFDLHYINLYNAEINYEIYERVGSESIYIIEKPRENWGTITEMKILSQLVSFFGEVASNLDCKLIVNKINTIITRIRPSMIIYVIESHTSIKIAKRLVGASDIQEIGIYWDPVEWQLESKKVDVINKKIVQQKNKNLIKKFEAILVPSNNMGNHFTSIGAKNIVTMHPYFE